MNTEFQLQYSIAKKAQDELFEKYGDPRNQLSYQRKWCIIWNVSQDFSSLPIGKIMIHKIFKGKIYTLFRLLEAKGLLGEIKKYCGCYEPRKSRTTQLLSLHYWAAAIDLNCNLEPLGSKKTHWSPEFLKCAEQAGLFWGGGFIHTKDPMHFALLNG